ncbi:MAG: hypothetical protein U9P14_08635 [Gemmatimonadota bacterium]|nr:hypothetical protein [Gemmatimonadota bacterium]
MKSKVVFAVCALVVSGMTAIAQLPLLHSHFRTAEVGAWARYELSGEKSGGLSSLYIGVVGEETTGGRHHLWYEWTTAGRKDTSTVKMLLPADSAALEVSRMIIKQGSAQAYEMPFAGLALKAVIGQQAGLGIDLNDLASSAERAQRQGVKVETLEQAMQEIAGRHLETRHLHITQKDGQAVDLWLADEVPFFSLVRLRARGLEVNITGWDRTGASSRIGENYRSLDLKGMFKGLKIK